MYAYAGTGYINPHAVTQIVMNGATTTYSYDNNGNLTSMTMGATTTSYTWDYRNRLTQVTTGTATTTFGYDYSGQRVISQTASSTTVFPNKYFSITSQTIASTTFATSTSYIFANDQLVAYVEQDLIDGVATGTPRTFYVHPDHLGSTNVITGENGDVYSVRDYLPFGSTRVESGPQSFGRGYIGEFQDSADFSYLNNRYYRSSQGQFISQDLVHLAIGNPQQVQMLTGKSQQGYLTDPQLLNSYSYGRNNPIVNKDPSGNNPYLYGGAFLAGAIYGGIQQFEYDRAAGTVSSVPEYMRAEFTGGAQAVGALGATRVLGPAGALRVYGTYETGANVYDFTNKVLVNGSDYNSQQKIQSTDNLYRDLATRAVSIGVPKEYRIIYDSLRSIYDSLERVYAQTHQQQANNNSVKQGGSSATQSGGSGWSNGQTPTGTDSKGAPTYCLGFCGR
jgi:RHS repeat-associated protein